MRAVARRLGVAPNALYSHVASKNALVDELLDDVLAEVVPPADDVADPTAAVFELMLSTYDVLTAQPDLVPFYLARQGARGTNAHRLGDVMDTLLVRMGVSSELGDEARRTLIVFTMGFAAFATHPPIDPTTDARLAASESRQNFLSGLQWLLTGIATEPTV